MDKLILLASFLGTAFLFYLGVFDPSSPTMWLASTSSGFAYLRIAMMVVLLSLLATHPPRNIFLRYLVGSFAVSVLCWGFWSTYNYDLKILDFFSITEFSVATMIIVLEGKYMSAVTEAERLLDARRQRVAFQQAYIRSRR